MRKWTTIVSALTALVGTVVFSAGALAVKPPDVGPGEDPGLEPPDYGDLFILYRDVDGVPILKDFGDGVECLQPVTSESWEGCELVPDGEHVGKCLVPVSETTCGVLPEFALFTEEVDFGRVNEARSTDEVFQSQLDEVIINLGTAGCLDLDPAGRHIYSSLTDSGTVSSTMDSPLQSLAMYRELMRHGSLGPNVPLIGGRLDAAARALGAASDKSGGVTVDMVAYLNQFMGLTEQGVSDLRGRCIYPTQEVMGVVEPVEYCFLDYSGYSYDRASNFAALPERPYVPEGSPTYGMFQYLDLLSEGPPATFIVNVGSITAAVFEEQPGFTDGNIGGFAQAADDTRAVIEYMHTWPVPGEYEVTLDCEFAADTYFDVYISDVSGLQVPTRMVADTEGREGSVTVYNAGPADAEVTLTVTGEYDGEYVSMLRVENGVVTEEPIFDEPEVFLLHSGHSASFVFFFSMDVATTIEWTANAATEGDLDVNPDNNLVEERTIVKSTSGGGGGH